MTQRPRISEILAALNESRIRATYGAVATAIGCLPRRLGALLGRRRPEASWVVNAQTWMPTGYKPHELHRDLQSNPHVIVDSVELMQLISRYRSAGALTSSVLSETSRVYDWEQFERLIAEIYRRRGYRVVERGGARADGGVDLEVHKDGRRTLVQCKYWSKEHVGVSIVREMFGVMHHEGADAVVVACSGRFTSEAEQFARANQIELIDRRVLSTLLRQTNTDAGELLKNHDRHRGRLSPWKVVSVIALIAIVLVLMFLLPQFAADHVTTTITASRLATNPVSIRATEQAGEKDNTAPAKGLVRDPMISQRDPRDEHRFSQWYRKPSECVASASNPAPDLVACGNHRIRARREYFESTQ